MEDWTGGGRGVDEMGLSMGSRPTRGDGYLCFRTLHSGEYRPCEAIKESGVQCPVEWFTTD